MAEEEANACPHGAARRGTARTARHGAALPARRGTARHCPHGAARRGTARHGAARRGTARHGAARSAYAEHVSTTHPIPSPVPATGFRARLLGREPLFGTFLFMGSAGSAEIAARSGLDWVLIDQEHGRRHGRRSAAAARDDPGRGSIPGSAPDQGRATALVRVEQASRLRIGRALDLGAEGIMVPR